MIGYDKWKEKELSVTNLLLDPLNPRIPKPDLPFLLFDGEDIFASITHEKDAEVS